jgi:histidinol phosphatase-like PHP family hydrolase
MAKEQGLKFTLGSDTRDKKPEDLTTLTDCKEM